MASYKGTGSSITLGGSALGESISWNLNSSIDLLDDTVLGDLWKSFKGGLAKWSGEVSGFVDYDDAQQKIAIDDILAATPTGDTVAMIFLVATGKTFGGNAICSAITMNASKDNVVEISFTFTGIAALTPTWA